LYRLFTMQWYLSSQLSEYVWRFFISKWRSLWLRNDCQIEWYSFKLIENDRERESV
jgi:hypothetical protein